MSKWEANGGAFLKVDIKAAASGRGLEHDRRSRLCDDRALCEPLLFYGLLLGRIVTLPPNGVTTSYGRFTENAKDLQSPNMTDPSHPLLDHTSDPLGGAPSPPVRGRNDVFAVKMRELFSRRACPPAKRSISQSP
jgi:hypothetical protein